MNCRFRIFVAVLTFCLCIDSVRSDDAYQVGVAVVDITPDYPIRLNGFGNRREESEGVSQPIFAKALAISQQGQAPLVLVTLDNLGVRTPMVDEVARRLQKSHQLPRQNLVVTFTHSHCAPKVNGASDNIFSQAIPDDHQKHIDRYTSELTDQIADVARRAIEERMPARLEWAIGKVGFAKNRRTVGGPVDHDLPMLVVRDIKTNQPLAIYVSYACHCVTLSFNKISGDWAGYAAAMIERMVPGAVALVSIGAGSDQNPVSGVTGDQTQVAEAQGIEIGTEVKRLLAEELKPITGTPMSVLNQIALPLNELPTRAELLEQTGKGRPTDQYNAETQLARLDRGEQLISQIDYPIQTWSFGDSFCMTFLAGEVCVDYALRLKTELDRERFWLNAYSNDFGCYIPSERLVAEGGYGGGAEVPYFALPTTLKAGLEPLIVDEVHLQVPEAFHVPKGTQGVAPKEPQGSLQCMTTHDDLQIRLLAAEPNVIDPVAIDFGTDGRLWVAEMSDYGRGVYDGFEPSSRVRWLRDTDRDGQFDEVRTFVEGLRFPTDVKVWRDGVLICDAPDILFARDNDGDGTADVVTKLFSGFEIRNAQARVNSLRFGLDNWIYGAGGLFGGAILSHQTGETVDCRNRDFRMNPDSGAIEPVSGRTQQGRCRNDWGDWFGCSNGSLLQAIPSDERYAKRNPFFPPSSPPLAQIDAEAHKLYPPENLVTFELTGTPGRATAACGLGIYRDVLLGPEYVGDAFTCEPVNQSVHRIDFSASGHGFRGRRGAGEESREFLSSTDRWFRPVQARTGPDGALWIVDMYRYVIEHSRWIPQATLADLDVYAGQQRGRIYHLMPKTIADPRSKTDEHELLPNLSVLSNRDLVRKLDSTNGPIRDLAHQMLLWRDATDVVPAIRSLVETATIPVGTIHALSVLDGLNQLKAADVQAALKSEHTEIIRFALSLSEPLLDMSPELRDVVVSLAANDNVRVRRQVALSIGATGDPSAAQTLVGLLRRRESDAHVRAAALNSVSSDNIDSILDQFLSLSEAERGQGAYQSLMQLAIKVANSNTVNQVLRTLVPAGAELPPEASVDFLVESFDGLDARSKSQTLKCDTDAQQNLQRLYRTAMDVVDSQDHSDAETIVALKLLGRRFGPFTQSVLTSGDGGERLQEANRIRAMAKLASPRFSRALQQQAITAIAATGAAEAVEALLSAYDGFSKELRIAVIDGLLTQKAGPRALLTAIEAGSVRPQILDASRRSKLLSSIQGDEREAAENLLGSRRKSSRSALANEMQGILQLAGDPSQGRVVFRKHCSSCHKLEDHGHVVGPDLSALTNRDPSWLLTTILDPNRDVDARYISWIIITQDGQTVTGMIVEETETAIRLRESGGKEHIIDRAEIDAIRSLEQSLMPEGLEKDMSAQDLSDVIVFLGGIASPPKKLAGTDAANGPLPRYPPQIAPFLLDESQSTERRQQVIDQRPGMGPAIVSLLVAGLEPDDIQEEYRRIPWIWRVAIAVGKRNDGGEIRDLLETSVPAAGSPLRDWQAVVIGGGLINGVSQLGLWPQRRLTEILSSLPALGEAWPGALERAAVMANDEGIRSGTRYDALRMVALLGNQRAEQQLQLYLKQGTPTELQMGAVSGLSDMNSPTVVQPLIDSLEYLAGPNRRLAIEGLLRSDHRAEALRKWMGKRIQSGEIALTPAEFEALKQHRVESIRRRAVEMFENIAETER